MKMNPLKMTEPSDVEFRSTKEFLYKFGDRPVDGYTIKRGIGRGGFGEVYYALSDGGKEVALKLIQRHLDVELRGVGQCLNLKNPNLVAIYDVRHNDKGENWVVMEHMGGPSLQERLQRLEGAMPVDEAFHWLSGIASAIDYLHQQGIVHRDLKPGNVFGEGDLVKLGDYGLSKFISASRRSGQTESVGTVHYMAPEISTGHYGRSIDIYSAAVIAFEMLTGTVPFDGESAGEILMKHLTAEPSLDRLPPAMRPVFARALAKDPADRFQSVGTLLDALRAAHQGNKPASPPVETTPVGRGSPPPLPGQKKRLYEGADEAYEKYVDAINRVQALNNIRGDTIKTSLPPLPGTFKSKRRAVADTLWSLFVAGLLGSAVPAAGYAIEVATSRTGSAFGLGFVWMALTSTLATWGLILLGKIWDSRPTLGINRRASTTFLGGMLGVVSLALGSYFGCLPGLEIPNIEMRLLSGPRAWEQIWRDHGSTIMQFLVIFSVIGFVPDWFHRVTAYRQKKFSLWRVLWPTALAAVVSLAVFDGAGRVFAEHLSFSFAGLAALTSFLTQVATPYRKVKLVSPNRLRPLRKMIDPKYLG